MYSLDKLIENLATLTSSEFDEILDNRDLKEFDHAWCTQNQVIPDADPTFEAEEIFVKLSEITDHHEICSYIADDLDLLYRAEQAGIKSDFLSYLKSCYQRGEIPSNWKG